MSDWPVGISTGCFFKTSIFECLDPLVAGGFTMLEICSSPAHLDYHDIESVRKVAKGCQERGIECYSFHAPFADHIDITSPDPHMRRNSLHEIQRAAEAAATLQVRHFVIHPGPEKSFQVSPGERLDRMRNAADVLSEVAEYCNQIKVGIVLENMLPHLFFGNVPDMLWIMGAIRGVKVGTCVDTGHAMLSGGLYTVTYKLSGHLQLVHASDTNGTYDDHLPPGEGSIDWFRWLLTLARMGFSGGIIMEIAGGRPIEEIMLHARKGRAHIRRISRDFDVVTPPTIRVPIWGAD